MPHRTLLTIAVLTLTRAALAQETPVKPNTPLPEYAQRITLPAGYQSGGPGAEGVGYPNIVLTGYWPPTNEMVREFSNNPAQNPGGWIGSNWEGRGYNVYAFFPEFPGGVLQRGVGDFEVDYQDTSADWWNIIPQYNPIAIITFSRANTTNGWELEGGNRTYVTNSWTSDYLAPTRPGAGLPIIDIEPPLTERFSTLPFAQIIADVTASGANVNPFSTVIDDGRFLSNFIGYHGCWYRFLHQLPTDPVWCVAAGHIHIGQSTALPDAVLATKVTLRTLCNHVDTARLAVQPIPLGDMNCDGQLDGRDVEGFAVALLDAPNYTARYPGCILRSGDFNADLAVTPADIPAFVDLLVGL